MALIGLNEVSLSFGGPLILNAVDLQIEEGERLGLLGRNGAGKSTLLKILEGTLAPDSGDVARLPGLRVAGLPQDVPQRPHRHGGRVSRETSAARPRATPPGRSTRKSTGRRATCRWTFPLA